MGDDTRSRRGRVGGTWREFSTVIFVVFVVILEVVTGDRTFTKVYEPIKGTAACFKRLNGTSEIGCRSSSKGEVGVLHVIDSPSSLQWVLTSGPHAPYIVITYPEHFTRENLLSFRSSGRVNGVLLLPDPPKVTSSFDDDDLDSSTSSTSTSISKKPPPSFSTDSSCPNNQFGFYNASTPNYCRAWNPPGNGLLFENFDFPIFFVRNTTEAATLIKCYRTFNEPINGTAQDWPLCAGQLQSFMMAAKDTPTCIRRSSVFSINPGTSKVCDPLGDQNLVATLFPPPDATNATSNSSTTNTTSKALILAARIDGASLFDDMSPSADSSVTSLVTLLAVIKHLASIRDSLPSPPSTSSSIDSVYFMLFNGESFGYIGSSRMAYDMSKKTFPLPLNSISYFLELNQVAPRGSDSPYFLHQTDHSQSKQFTDLLVNQARLQNLSLTTLQKDPSSSLPPSSLHSFLRHQSNLTGILLTNHKDSYTNPYYNSIFDTKESLHYTYLDRSVTSLQQKLASLSAAVANSILQLLQDSPPSTPIIKPDLDTVDELLHCYLDTSNCSLFRAISGFDPPKPPQNSNSTPTPIAPYPLYVGVATHPNYLTQLTRGIIVSYLGELIGNVTSKELCFGTDPKSDPGVKDRARYFFNGSCYDCPEVNLTEAKSPAFIIPDYDWGSGSYSTWTESVWQKFSVRIFLKPSLLHEVMTLVSGVVVVLLSFGVVRFVSGKADVIFPSRSAGGSSTDAIVC